MIRDDRTFRRGSQRLAAVFTVVAGIALAALAFTVLFLPFFTTCLQTQNGLICTYESYVEMGGNALGYTVLLLFFALGTGAIVSTWAGNATFICGIRWLTVLTTLAFAVIGSWSIGLVFLPAGLLMLLPAISCLHRERVTAQTA